MIAIVGAGVAGLSAATALRELGYAGVIRVFSAEAATPYERPALSKTFLTDGPYAEPPALVAAGVFEDARIELALDAEVTQIDAAGRTIATAADEEVHYDRLLLAPGAVPRRLDIPGAQLRGVHYLRELRSARLLRTALRPGRSVAVVGGGVIGLEVAASATAVGARATVIEAAPQVMGRVVPHEFGKLLEALHSSRGVSVRVGVRPVGFHGSSGYVRGVALDDGSFVPADVVVVGIGVVPRTDLATGAGLPAADGIVVDSHFRSSDERIFAAGDAARVFHEHERRHVRTEQWGPAQDQGRHAAAAMLGAVGGYRDVPWMWSDQHDLHCQATGFGFAEADVALRGTIDDERGIICLGTRAGRLVAACGVSIGTGVARNVRAAHLLIERGTPVDHDQLADPTVDLRRLARHS